MWVWSLVIKGATFNAAICSEGQPPLFPMLKMYLVQVKMCVLHFTNVFNHTYCLHSARLHKGGHGYTPQQVVQDPASFLHLNQVAVVLNICGEMVVI